MLKIKKYDNVLSIQWTSLVFLYIGYFIGRFINYPVINYIIGGVVALIMALLFTIFHRYNPNSFLNPVLLSICSGIVIAGGFKEFVLDYPTISIMIGYGILLLIIHFVGKMTKYDIYLFAFAILFLGSLLIYNFIDYSLSSQLNILLSIYIIPVIFVCMIAKREDEGMTSLLSYAYFASLIIFLFYNLFMI